MEFWNQQLKSAEVDVRLGPIARLIQPVSDDALRQLSAAVLGGYHGVEPDIPEELRQIPGDIVVALSTADLWGTTAIQPLSCAAARRLVAPR